MTNRPLCIFGAAFLLTVAAALFAPSLLLVITAPIAFLLVFPSSHRNILTAVAAGSLSAVLCCLPFAIRTAKASSLVGSTVSVTGTVFRSGTSQLIAAYMPDGSRTLLEIFPTLPNDAENFSISGKAQINGWRRDSSLYTMSGGIILTASVSDSVILPESDLSLPLAIKLSLLRQRLASALANLNPAPATSITCGVLFSYRSAIDKDVRAAFNRSGMGHLLSVSGLHLSILVSAVLAAVRHLGGGRKLQAISGMIASLLLFFAAGMSPSIFRAAVMSILTLSAWLFSRRSDGLTSLSAAAVILVGICPPVIADISFLLSFLAVLGILVLAPRLTQLLRQLVISRIGHCGKSMQTLITGISVSLAAQLFTLPVVAWEFGSVPVFSLLFNLLAIPLSYPLLLSGFFSVLCLLSGIVSAAGLFLLPANLCSSALVLLAKGASALPMSSMSTLFPMDFLVVALVVFSVTAMALLPASDVLRPGVIPIASVTILAAFAVSAVLNYNSITVISSAVTGSLIVSDHNHSAVIECSKSPYHRRIDSNLLSRFGHNSPDVLVCPYPYDDVNRIAAAAFHYELSDASVLTAMPSSDFTQLTAQPQELFSGAEISCPAPYTVEITVAGTKLMKYYAVYDTIIKYGTTPPHSDAIISDRSGNIISVGGKVYIFRRANGDSYTRIPKQWR